MIDDWLWERVNAGEYRYHDWTIMLEKRERRYDHNSGNHRWFVNWKVRYKGFVVDTQERLTDAKGHAQRNKAIRQYAAICVKETEVST